MAKGDWLGEFEICVLLAVAALGDAAYGIRVRNEIEARTGRAVAIGAVYATLARLEDKGLARFKLDEPQPVPGGRARKCFRLTAAGTRALAASTSVLTRMMAGWRAETAR
jgi:PadR family transcriptional regulator, regulatory protein PadR